MIDRDPVTRHERDVTVRQILASQLNKSMVESGAVESVRDDESAKSGPVLRIHSDTCSQRMANMLVANEARLGGLRKAGWQRLVCHKSMFSWYTAEF